MNNELTKKEDWILYWRSKNDLLVEIPENYPFSDIIRNISKTNKNIRSVIELGGFPGTFSVIFKKYFNYDVTLFDQFLDVNIIENVLLKNGLKPGDIKIIEGDILEFQPEYRYDLVCSFGLIEHFIDIDNIFSNHLKFLNPGGTLLVILPNFKGLNGLIQRIFDVENLKKHNLNAMKLKTLHNSVIKLGVLDISVKYYLRFGIWLENFSNRPRYVKFIFYLLRQLGKMLRIIYPFNSVLFSPWIVLTCKGPNF